MVLSSWIEQQYRDLQRILLDDEIEFLKLVSRYEGFKHPYEFIASRIKMELSHYREDLRFSRWLKKRR